MKKLIVTLLTLCLLLSLAVPAMATSDTSNSANSATSGEMIHKGNPEDDTDDSYTKWELSGTVLTIRSIKGPGKMPDFAEGPAPWAAYKDTITTVKFTGGVSYVGAFSFKDYDKITSVSLDAKTEKLGESAFMGCDGLTQLSIPFTGKFFMGKDSLRECKNLKRIDFAGRFPKFETNCLWDTYATLYYPANAPWPADTVEELEKAFKGRIEFRGSDGSDPVKPTEAPKPTEPKPTQAKPKPTTGNNPTPTETVTTPTWSVPTEDMTFTQPTFTLPTYVPQNEDEQEEGGGFSGWIAVVAVIGLLAGFAAVTIHIQESQRRKRRKRRRPRPDFNG